MSEHSGGPVFTGDIQAFFVAREWVRGAGGHLYYNGLGTTGHPHLHMIVSTFNEDGIRLVRESADRLASDLRQGIKMLALSDGQQHQGGGGRTGIEAYQLTSDWRDIRRTLISREAMYKEFVWIISYYTTG